jgi:murein L,D-transpeptidase YcbB/YkuD
MPKATDSNTEERVDLRDPIPVFVTYLTAEAVNGQVLFRVDPYDRDPAVLARYFGEDRQLAFGSSH